MSWHPDISEEWKNQIILGDCKELVKQIPDESIDLILTDPPYIKEYLWTYEWLSIIASKKLKQDGFLLAYCGPYHKYQVMEKLGYDLEYYWDFIIRHKGNTTILWNRKIISGYKSVLAFIKPNSKALPRGNIVGLINGIGSDKRYHKWGQSIHEPKIFLNYFTERGDIVLDPFAGAGTIPGACKLLGRNYIGFEIDSLAIKKAELNLSNLQPPLFILEPEQLEIEELK